ncbi:MAG TPA: hypothetical protein VN803_13200 [Gemmatimonadales bacterium]|nr:hypothetical protein [Gemmatimonadales bacterium]
MPTPWRALILLSAGAGLLVTTAAAQQPFLYTLTPAVARAFVSADLGYGERLFAGVGPERLEPRLAAQLALGTRFTLALAGGFAPQDPSVTTRASGAVELLGNIAPARSRGFAALGVGGMLDYRGSAALLGRVALGLRSPRWELAGNLRLEHSLAPAHAQRDALDVVTSLGVSRRMARPLRIGVEAVGEDLEGLFDPNEAEGGAKLLLGPTLGFTPTPRWQLLVGAGPVLRLSQSPRTGVPAPRDLITRSGYVIRTSIAYQW